MSADPSALCHFHPLVVRWFESRIGRTTRIQEKAWPLIATHHHVLITAPTGSGKTLAAFLWAIDRLIQHHWVTGETAILYISPLKAINNDIQRNLIQPLFEIRNRFEAAGVDMPTNMNHPHPIAYAHHGSLSKPLRLEVEQRLKNGDLKAIVATSSLELGIDIGALDRVVLVQAPKSISSAVQRIGRSGHGVGQTSRASFFATHAVDTLNAAVLAEAVMEQDIEPLKPVDCPLDVLAQVIVAMVGVETWDLDHLFAFACPWTTRKRQMVSSSSITCWGATCAHCDPFALTPSMPWMRLAARG